MNSPIVAQRKSDIVQLMQENQLILFKTAALALGAKGSHDIGQQWWERRNIKRDMANFRRGMSIIGQIDLNGETVRPSIANSSENESICPSFDCDITGWRIFLQSLLQHRLFRPGRVRASLILKKGGTAVALKFDLIEMDSRDDERMVLLRTCGRGR